MAARRVDGVRRPLVPTAPGDERCPRGEPVPETALLLLDEEYGRDGRTRCAAEIRNATYILARTM
jgi:hypothetical protein